MSRLVDAIRDELPIGCRLPKDIEVVELRERDEEVVVVLQRGQSRHRHGLPVPLDTSRSYYYGQAVSSVEEWLAELWVGVHVQLGTGYLHRATRHEVDGVLELRDPTWPIDERYYPQDAPTSESDVLWRPFLARMRQDGLDPGSGLAGVAGVAGGSLIAWMTAYVNTAPSGPDVAVVCVRRVDDGSATLDLQLVDGVPVTAALDLARFCLVEAEAEGIAEVTTDADFPGLALLGFARHGTGLVAPTHLLDSDVEGAKGLLRETGVAP